MLQTDAEYTTAPDQTHEAHETPLPRGSHPYMGNALLFAVGIAAAPISVVLFSVSTMPVFAALFSWRLLGEATHWSTWVAIFAVLGGIALAVFGSEPSAVTGRPIIGAAAGLGGLISTGQAAMGAGHIWAIVLAGSIVLPISFFALSLASRFTHASNVSLLMLLETILGPLWVWVGTGEAPTRAMLAGGAVVIVSLGTYQCYAERRQAKARSAKARLAPPA